MKFILFHTFNHCVVLLKIKIVVIPRQMEKKEEALNTQTR